MDGKALLAKLEELMMLNERRHQQSMAAIARISGAADELKDSVSRLEKASAQQAEEITALRADVAGLKSDVAGLGKRIDIERTDQLERFAEVAEIRGRVEEQSKFLQLVLAAGQSRKPAA